MRIALALLIAVACLASTADVSANAKHTLTFSADPVHVGEGYVVHLTGFSPNWRAIVVAEYPSGDVISCQSPGGDGSGCYPNADGTADVTFTAIEAGTIRHEAYSDNSYARPEYHILAAGDLTVLP